MTLLSRLALAALIPAGLAACNKVQAHVPGPVASLEMPEPPGRSLIPVELPEYVEPVPAPVEEPEPPPSTARPAVAVTRPTPPAATPAAPAPEAPPPPVLQTTSNTAALEQKIVQLLGSAQQNLKSVNFRDLSATGRAHYDRTRDFIRMAGDALKIRNFMLAEQLAIKAAAVADLLVKG